MTEHVQLDGHPATTPCAHRHPGDAGARGSHLTALSQALRPLMAGTLDWAAAWLSGRGGEGE